MVQKIEFDDSRARTYRKCQEVLAFKSDSDFSFSKIWGKQEIRAAGWIIVPLSDDGKALSDVYGCDEVVFEQTYEPSPSQRANRYRKTATVRAYKPGVVFEIDTVLPDGYIEVKGSRSGSQEDWIVRNQSDEVYIIEDMEFGRTYVEVLQRSGSYRNRNRDDHWKADGQPKRILALDGGGVRGILTLGYLERIEEILRKRHGDSTKFRLSHYFDLIAGTSTGAIIAACLAKGMKVGEVRKKYNNLASCVFKRSFFRQGILRAKYSSKQLHKYLKNIFANNTMASTLDTGLLVVAKRLDTGSVWPMSNNPSNPYWTAPAGASFLSNEDYLLRSVVRASTAAPFYFAAERIEVSADQRPHGFFVDGGVSPHNNPALIALQMVTINGFGANWPLDPDKLMLVSVGTGSAQPGTSNSSLAGKHAINSLRSLMDDCAEAVETILQWLSTSPTAREIDAVVKDLSPDLLAERPLLHYLRYNVQFEKSWFEDHLGMRLDKNEIQSLKEMDQPKNMDQLSIIGQLAASKQIDPSHFPPGFDLGR